jgi:hypothetical protein
MSRRLTLKEALALGGEVGPLRPKRIDGFRSQLEADFAAHLRSGFLGFPWGTAKWKYEPMSLRLGRNCKYTPDFLVWNPDLKPIFYEVKGSWKAKGGVAARVRLKIAASLFNELFDFYAVTRVGGRWLYEQIRG